MDIEQNHEKANQSFLDGISLQVNGIEDLLNAVLTVSNGVMKTSDNTSPELRRAFTSLVRVTQHTVRVSHICQDATKQGFEEAVWWFSENGDLADLELLEARMKDIKKHDVDKWNLLRMAQADLEGRVGQNRWLNWKAIWKAFAFMSLVSFLMVFAICDVRKLGLIRVAGVAIAMTMGLMCALLLLIRSADRRRVGLSRVILRAAAFVMFLESLFVLHLAVLSH